MGVSYGKVAVGILLITLALLILIIAYRKLLAFMSKGEIPKDKYCVLNSLEVNPAKGEIEFYFTCEEPVYVDFEILNADFSINQTVSSKEYTSGGNIIRFDSTKIANGSYFFQLRTENQKAMKKFDVLN
ncbi:MAG: hypothetical protein V4622_11700 [Bacteroidota bacterium]